MARVVRPCVFQDHERDAIVTTSFRLTSAFIKVVPLRAFVLVAGSLASNACHSTGPDPNAAAYAAVASGTGDDFRTAVRDTCKNVPIGPATDHRTGCSPREGDACPDDSEGVWL